MIVSSGQVFVTTNFHENAQLSTYRTVFHKLIFVFTSSKQLLRGHPTQSVSFEMAETDRNMQVRFNLMSVLEC